MNYFRIQGAGHNLEEMKQFDSGDGGDGSRQGLCVSDTPDSFGGAWRAHNDDDEVVILEGVVITEIYDGYRIRPTKEVGRFTKAEWRQKLADGSAWDFEDWS